MTNIRKRLKKLESQVPPKRSNGEQKLKLTYHWFTTCSIAYYLGDPTPEESVAEAYARALGYSNTFEFKQAFKASDSDLAERTDLATDRLLAKFGVTREHEWGVIADAFKRMEAGFSDFYKRTLHDGAARLLA